MPQSIPVKLLDYEEKLLIYTKLKTDYINMEAVFSDETENYVFQNTVKIRTAKDNVDSVYLIAEGVEIPSVKTESDDMFDYFSSEIPSKKLTYCFKIIKNEKEYYYNKQGLKRELDNNYNFILIPDFETPEWAKGAIIYQIFVDRFCNGDKSNDVVNNEYMYLERASKNIENWFKPLEPNDICNFYGGDLKGITDKIGYLKELGVDVIFLNPIFVSPSTHKYDTQDYDYVDPHFGQIVEDGGEPLFFGKFNNKMASKYVKRTTDKKNLEASNEILINLIESAHQNGIKVILDGVFNHCGAFNKWLDKEGFYFNQNVGAYREKDSPYHKYFRWDADEWPNNNSYDSWWGHNNHPKLNFEGSEELYQYIMDVGKKWVSPPFNADGWRLDVAADLGHSQDFNHQFWGDFRKAVKSANPEAIILAEHYGNPEKWLQGDQWDTIMNYDAFMEPITWFLTGMEKHSEEFRGDMLCNAEAFENAMRYHMSRFPIQSLQIAMNELSNHDHSRFLTRTNMSVGRLHTKGAEAAEAGINKGIFFEAVVFQMTWPGAPTIYYGDEAGVCGWTDPDNRRTYPWGREDTTVLDFHKQIISIHKQYDCLKNGSVEYLYMDYGVISFGRWNKNNMVGVVLNNNSTEKNIVLPLWKIGIKSGEQMKTLIQTGETGYEITGEEFVVQDGTISVTLKPYSALVIGSV